MVDNTSLFDLMGLSQQLGSGWTELPETADDIGAQRQHYQANIQSGLIGSHSPDALQSRQYYNNQLAGLSNAAAQQQYQSRGNQFVPTTIELNCSPETVVREEPKPRKRHWLLSWLPKSDPVVGRDFQPKKTLTEAEKAYWGV